MDSNNLLKSLGSKELPFALGEQTFTVPNLVEVPMGDDTATFLFGEEGKIQVDLFNDYTSVIPGKKDELVTILASQEQPNSTDVWLKYSGLVSVRSKSGIDVSRLGFKFSGMQSFQSSTYRKHTANEILGEAILGDTTKFKTILSAEQVKALAPGEAVTFALAGQLESSLKITWADIFSGSLLALGTLLSSGELLKLRVGASAAVRFSIKVEDNFKVKIIRKQKDTFLIGITRNSSTAKAGAVGLKVRAEFEDPNEIEKIFSGIVEGFFGEPEKRLEIFLEKTETDLTELEQDIISKISGRLGWRNVEHPHQKLRTEYLHLKSELKDKICELARVKIEAGFTYDYIRLNTHSVVLEAETNARGIDKFHSDILKMNVSPLLDSVRKNEGLLETVSFLQKEVLSVVRSSGFSIGFGKWKAASSKKMEVKPIIEENQFGNKKISYEGKRSYSERAGGDGIQWKIDLLAEMPVFSTHKVPYANEFDYGLYLELMWVEKELTLAEVRRFTDLATIWGILDESESGSDASRIFQDVKGARDAKLHCEIKLTPTAFKTMLPALAAACRKRETFAAALGKAMPCWNDFPARNNISLRTQSYGQLWNSYLKEREDTNPSTQIYADEAFRLLKKIDPQLAEAELNYRTRVANSESFGSILNTNPATYLRNLDLANGLEQLAKGSDPSTNIHYDKVIETAFDLIGDFWRYPHHLRTFGALVAMVARTYPGMKEHIDNLAMIEYTDANGKQIVEVLKKT